MKTLRAFFMFSLLFNDCSHCAYMSCYAFFLRNVAKIPSPLRFSCASSINFCPIIRSARFWTRYLSCLYSICSSRALRASSLTRST